MIMIKTLKKGSFWPLVYPLIIIKILIFYWFADRLDMMAVLEVSALTFLFFTALFELFCLTKNRGLKIVFYLVYLLISLILFADIAYSGYFGRYASVNQLFQLGSLGQIAQDGGVIGATVSPLSILIFFDLPFVFFF